MIPSKGQYLDILNTLGLVDKDNCVVTFEEGNDINTTFEGSFIVKIKYKGKFSFVNGRIIDYLFD